METDIVAMEAKGHLRVIAELDVLSDEVAHTILRFEEAGATSIMKDDYVALHVLAHRIMEMRLKHSHAHHLKVVEAGRRGPQPPAGSAPIP